METHLEKKPNQIGQIIKDARTNKKITQMDLSRAAGYDYNVACHWETGYKKLKKVDAESVIETLDLPKDVFEDLQHELLTEEEEKPNRGTRIDTKVNQIIKSLRESRRLTKKEVALAVDMIPFHLSRIENNQSNPTIDQLRRLKEYFAVSWDELLDGAPSAQPTEVSTKDKITELENKVAKLEVDFSAIQSKFNL